MILTPEQEDLIRISAGLLIMVGLFWFGTYLETCRKRMIEKVRKKLDPLDNIDPC